MSQLRLLQRLGRTGIHAVDPALDLLNGQSVMTAGLTDLDLEPTSRAEAFDPPIFLQPGEAKSCLVIPVCQSGLDENGVRDGRYSGDSRSRRHRDSGGRLQVPAMNESSLIS